MYLCVRGIATKPVPSQEDERSCICVLEVSLPSLYQARKVRGHVFVLEVMYLCVRGHVFVLEVIYLC
jgi:hypothetical protein